MNGWTLGIADVAVGTTLAACGATVLVGRKERRIGALLLLAAATWFAGSLWAPLVFLNRGPMVHLHLSYPTGRLRRWPAVVATVSAYVWALAEGWLAAPAVTAGLALMVGAAATDGYVRTHGPARRAGLPGFVAALLFAGILLLSALDVLLDLRADLVVALAYDVVMIFVSVWLTVDLLRGRWTEATLAQLVSQVGGEPGGVGVEADLRRALGDPRLTVGFWDASRHEYLDPRGAPVASEGALLVLDDAGDPLAAVRHDPALGAEPALLEGAAAVLRMVASNARLREEIRLRGDQLEAARRRLIVAADERRRALHAEIAAGPGAQLAAAASALASRAPDGGVDLEAEVAEAQAELDRFAAGLGPPLDSDGLPAALLALAAHAGLPVRTDIDLRPRNPTIEATIWFVCAEALTNAVKHAHASTVFVRAADDGGRVHIEVTDDGDGGVDPTGSGLRGLADRVAALGGTLTVSDADGGGTVVSASIPDGGAP